jgi:hypothetical protein
MPRRGLQEHDQGSGSNMLVDALDKGRNKRVPQPCWCPTGLTKTQQRRLQKLRQKELELEKEEKAHDAWFDKARPPVNVKQPQREKRLVHKECSGSEGSDQEENDNDDKMGVNMVFVLPKEFRAPKQRWQNSRWEQGWQRSRSRRSWDNT